MGAGGTVPSPPPRFGSRAESVRVAVGPKRLLARSGDALSPTRACPWRNAHRPKLLAPGATCHTAHAGRERALGCGHTGHCAKQTLPGPALRTGQAAALSRAFAAATPRPCPLCPPAALTLRSLREGGERGHSCWARVFLSSSTFRIWVGALPSVPNSGNFLGADSETRDPGSVLGGRRGAGAGQRPLKTPRSSIRSSGGSSRPSHCIRGPADSPYLVLFLQNHQGRPAETPREPQPQPGLRAALAPHGASDCRAFPRPPGKQRGFREPGRRKGDPRRRRGDPRPPQRLPDKARSHRRPPGLFASERV